MLLTKAATIQLDLAIFRAAYSLPENAQLIIARKLECIIKELRAMIDNFNQNNTGSHPAIKTDCPALHLLTEFALFECIKNSIDARAHTLTLSIYLGDNRVLVSLQDDGPRGANQKSYSDYLYENALKSKSEKKQSAENCLGGNGKGLAMSAQYLSQFAKSSALLSGHLAEESTGFTVTLSSENESITTPWRDYLREFEQFYRSVKNELYSAAAAATASSESFQDKEQSLIKRVKEHEANRQALVANPLTFFSFDSAGSAGTFELKLGPF